MSKPLGLEGVVGQISSAKNLQQDKQAGTANLGAQPSDEQDRIRYGTITKVNENNMVKVKLLGKEGLPDGDDIVGGAFLPLMTPLPVIYLLWGTLRKGLICRVFWRGKLDPNASTIVEIIADDKTYVKKYTYNTSIEFFPKEIIHIRDNNGTSIFRGRSRLEAANKSIDALHNMVDFQNNFFKNGAVPGLVIKSPDVLGKKIKDRILIEWMQKYNPKTGGRRPMVLDGGFEIDKLGNTNFKELGFEESIESHENKILKALGVPPILLNSGNNANITPNLKLFYITTIIPLTEMVLSSLEFFFGYNLKNNTREVLALRPELNDEANYYSTLVNAGILTRNEARDKLRFDKATETFADELIIPANIAGSALDSFSGGKPKEDGNKK